MADVCASNGDFETAVGYERQALNKLPSDHLFLRGYYEETIVDYLVRSDRIDEAQRLLRTAIQDRHAAALSLRLQFHRANVRLKLVELLITRPVHDQIEVARIFDEAVQILKRSPNRVSQTRATRLAKLMNVDYDAKISN